MYETRKNIEQKVTCDVYEGEFITEPWDAYIFNNHGDIKIMSKKSLLRLMDECNINIEIRE